MPLPISATQITHGDLVTSCVYLLKRRREDQGTREHLFTNRNTCPGYRTYGRCLIVSPYWAPIRPQKDQGEMTGQWNTLYDPDIDRVTNTWLVGRNWVASLSAGWNPQLSDPLLAELDCNEQSIGMTWGQRITKITNHDPQALKPRRPRELQACCFLDVRQFLGSHRDVRTILFLKLP